MKPTLTVDLQDKPLALPYAEAVMAMLPQTRYQPRDQDAHEHINDLPVHPSTAQQIFYPTSESRQFTRVDAAKVFDSRLLPADERLPHADHVLAARDSHEGLPEQERFARIIERDQAKQAARHRQEQKKKRWEAENLKTVSGPRWDFRIQQFSVDEVGKQGRGRAGVGWRYGAPNQDRKRGQIKIATSVE